MHGMVCTYLGFHPLCSRGSSRRMSVLDIAAVHLGVVFGSEGDAAAVRSLKADVEEVVIVLVVVEVVVVVVVVLVRESVGGVV